MPRFLPLLAAGVMGLAATASTALLVRAPVLAADHLDPPSRTDIRFDPTVDLPADIADVYAWTTPTHLNLVYTFAGPSAGTLAGFYDPAVVYRFHLSYAGRTDDDEALIVARFGEGEGGYGLRVDGIPGVTGPVIGPVERILEQDGVKVFAGVVADPFFFDVLGFRQTVASGNLSILNTRNFFAEGNDTMIGVQIPIERVNRDSNGDGRYDQRIDVWVDAFRKGGQL